MENQTKLLNLIEKQIDTIKKYISDISFDNIDEAIKNKNLIEQNFSLNGFNFLNNFDLNSLRRILPNSFEKDLVNLSFYTQTSNTSYVNELNNQPEVVGEIKEILARIHTYLSNLIIEQEEEKRKAISFGKTKAILEKLKSKLLANEDDFDEEEIETVYSILNSLEDKDTAIELMISFGEKLLKTNETLDDISEEKEELIENKDVDSIKTELTTIFNKFDLNFNGFYSMLTHSEQQEFIQYVKPDNVEVILNTLKEFNIDLNDAYYNSPLLLYKAKQLKEIFMYSSGQTIKKVLTIAEKEKIYNDEIVSVNSSIKSGIDFDLLLESPARFIERKHRYKRRGNEIIDIKIGTDSVGAANDFIKNMELFKSYGVSSIEFCKNTMVSITPNEKIKMIISIFKLYGISKNYFIKTLSCFCSIHQADVIDQFIELGQFDYILKNMSRCQLMPDSTIFYRLVYGLKHTNLPLESMITPKGNFTYLITDTAKKGNNQTFGITNYNKDQKVHQTSRFYGNQELYETYNELINPMSSDVSIALFREDSIVHLLDEAFLVKKDNGEIEYPNIYNFGTISIPRGIWNINISRNKVLRICNELMQHNVEINDMDTIMYIVTKNSILTEEEYSIIYNKIENARKRRVER